MSKAGGPNKGPVKPHKAMAAGESYSSAAAQAKTSGGSSKGDKNTR